MDESNAGQDNGLSRRRLLQLGALAAGAGALGVPAGLAGGLGHARGASVHGRPVAGPYSPAATPTLTPSTPAAAPWTLPAEIEGIDAREPAGPVPAHTKPTPPPNPVWLHTTNQPISSLDDVIAVSRGANFPRNAIMLTIDDGPHPVWTPKYLRLLAKYHVQATFCVIGRQVLQYPQLVKAVVSEGHDVANHTFAHPANLPQLTPAGIRRELEDTNDAVVHATGVRPHQFRAPGGVWGPDVFAEVSRQQMMPLGWDIDPRDWSLPGIDHIRTAMLAARPHDIILCHDGGGDRSETFAALSTVIPALLARGWRFVNLRAFALV